MTYNVSDSSANAAAEVTRLVTVVDTTAPVITLQGLPWLTLELCPGDVVPVLPGANATDACEGDLTGNIVVAVIL